MNIGKMERYITIEQPTYSISDDTNDKYISGWTTYKNCFASWIHKQSQEVFETGQMVAKDTFEWKFRHYDAPAVKMDMRINYDSDYYHFVGLKELGRKEAWLGTTIKRDSDGS
jgi:SPP1 family predicted phage head-tail adaptor